MNIPGLMRCFALCALLLCLASCLPKLDPGPAPIRVRLNPAMPGNTGEAPLNRQITVAMPRAAGDIDNDRIALAFHTREVRYLSGLRWAGNLAPMIQAQIMQALESTGVFSGVGDEVTGLSARARLQTDIRQFALVYASEEGLPVAEFAATFRLLNMSEAKIAATRQVDIQVPASGTDNPALIEAMEKALAQGLGEMAPWVARSVKNLR